MRILVTGGTGVVGTGAVTALVKRGHAVTLLTRDAAHDAAQWPSGVTPHPGDVSRAESVRGAAEGCDAVLHLAGIVDESPPDVTFERVNVQGTRHVVDEAVRAGVTRLVYASSLGAAAGESDYHRSKREAESVVRAFPGQWTIVRPGNVYGPGDEQISILLRMVRGISPLLPTVGDGSQPFQPLWWEDCAGALCTVVERDDLSGQALDIAGSEITSQNDLIRRMARITGRDVQAVPIPEFIASIGSKLVSLVGWDVGLNDDQLEMLREGNVIMPGDVNALDAVLGLTPTRLDDGLRQLADLQPEQLPTEGVGALHRKQFWADIHGTPFSPEQLLEKFRAHFNDVTPVFVDATAESNGPPSMQEGETITLALPLRGHAQIRVVEAAPRRITLVSVAGHPVAGAVRFLAEPNGNAVRFQVEVYDRAATYVDLIAMRALGDRLQQQTWKHVVRKVVALSGGTAPEGVQHEAKALDDAQVAHICNWLEALIQSRVRQENADANPDHPVAGSMA